MKKFLVVYLAPAEGLERWMKMDPETRKGDEEKMQADWQAWTSVHGTSILETAGAGKTKRVSKEGVEDIKNNMMLYSIVEAESHEAAASLFEGHPHLGIPDSTIEVMAINPLLGMG